MTEQEDKNKSCPILETKLDFFGRYRESILGGTKRISLRLGDRRFHKHVEVCGFHAIVNSQYVCKLRRVPFSIFWDEGWDNWDNMIQGLSKIYPGIDLDSVFTVVEFRLEIPHRKVQE